MKYKIILIIAALIIAILSYSVMAIKDGNSLPKQENNNVKQGKEVGILGVPSPIPGNIFERNYLRVGINDLGTLGVTNGTTLSDPGVGFQSVSDVPFQFPTTESTAVGWWGEGYVISYQGMVGDTCSSCKTAYFQPGFGWPCSRCNVQPISSVVGTNTKEVSIKAANDENLTVTFEFLLRGDPSLYLKTTFKNVGTLPMKVSYKRIVDWDICSDAINNNWASTATDAYAWGYCGPLNRMVQLTMAGHDGEYNLPNKFVQAGIYDLSIPIVKFVDLNAWDDMTTNAPIDVVQSYAPISGDYNAGIYYSIGELKPGESKSVYTIYQSNFPKIR